MSPRRIAATLLTSLAIIGLPAIGIAWLGFALADRVGVEPFSARCACGVAALLGWALLLGAFVRNLTELME